MTRNITSQPAARWIGLLLLTSFSGCFYIPTWRCRPPEICQDAEDAWGCAVDHIGHMSPIDQPWHDPKYCKRGIYRVAAYGRPYDYAGHGEYFDGGYPNPELGDMKPHESEGPALPPVPVVEPKE